MLSQQDKAILWKRTNKGIVTVQGTESHFSILPICIESNCVSISSINYNTLPQIEVQITDDFAQANNTVALSLHTNSVFNSHTCHDTETSRRPEHNSELYLSYL
jgi:hypothetical protein